MTTQNNALSAYQSHSLNIMMKTSSGDVIHLDFNKERSLNYQEKKDPNSSQQTLSFQSIEEFSFSIESNGLDEQDKKEIEAFMELAKPYIDNFLKELQDENQTSSINKVAQQITNTLSSLQNKDINTKNYTKNSLVELFDRSLKETKAQNETFDKLFKETQKLLEQTLKWFDQQKQPLYA